MFYTLDYINLNMTFQLSRPYIAQFTPQNIKKVKNFITDKKLFKALKIAQKMFLEDQLSVLKTQNCKISVKTKQFPSQISIQLGNNLKKQPPNIIIETPRIKLKKFICHDESQTYSDQQIKDGFQIKFIQKDDHIDLTYHYQQEDISQSKYFQSLSIDKQDFIRTQPKIEKTNVKKQMIKKKSQKNQKLKFFLISRYLYNYLIHLQKGKNIKIRRQTIEHIKDFIAQPLQDFKTEDFSSYAYKIDILMYLCTKYQFYLEDQNKQFIKGVTKILSKLYVTLRDYEGDNRFINGVKMLQLCKLKVFQKQVQTNIKIQD